VHMIACQHMTIGKNVVFADGVYVTDNLHGYEDTNNPIFSSDLVSPGPVAIEDEAWIGEHACVMPNVTIGRHAVVGANAVVTKNIPPFSVAVGVPARVIRQYSKKTGRWERT
jgi:acetyltransferase-like isoleucine patch superfamily enzyme